MAFRLSDLNPVTASVTTDLFHLRTVAGLDKKITNTDLFNTIPTLTTFGQTILARDGGQLLKGESTALKSGSGTELTGGGQFALLLASSITDATTKNNRLVGAHYTNAEEPLGMIDCANSASANVLRIGGGYAQVNAATSILFYTSANNTTVTGTEAGRISNAQNLLWGTIVDSGPRLVAADGVGALPGIGSEVVGLFQNNNTTGQSSGLCVLAGNAAESQIAFGDADDFNNGLIQYNHSDMSFRFRTGTGTTTNSEAMRLTSANHLLVNTTSDVATLHVDGDARFTGSLGHILMASNGVAIDFSRGGTNYLWGTTVGDTLYLGTNGRAKSTANSNLLLNADQSVTVNTTLFVDTIEEKTASAGVTFSSQIKYRLHYKASGNVTSQMLYDNLNSWVPTVDDYISVDGQTVDTGGVNQTSIYGIRRVSTTRVEMYALEQDGTLFTLIGQDGISSFQIEAIEIMANFDPIN